jgi:hypothetical protein
LKAKILAMLDRPEHIRSERVSKPFQSVGIDLSWHDFTVLRDMKMDSIKEVYKYNCFF